MHVWEIDVIKLSLGIFREIEPEKVEIVRRTDKSITVRDSFGDLHHRRLKTRMAWYVKTRREAREIIIRAIEKSILNDERAIRQRYDDIAKKEKTLEDLKAKWEIS